MKIRVKYIIFAVVFQGVLVSVETIAKDNAKAKEEKVVVAPLTKSHQAAFEQYIQEQYTSFVEQDEWKIFVEVVTYYNNSPSKLLNVNAEKQRQFDEAVSLLKHTLKHQDSPEAKIWLERLKKTSHHIRCVWKLEWDNLTPEETPQTTKEIIGFLNGF
ncbi:MAG: hypothetical protein ACK4GN_10465 [Runella sp.]